MLYMPPSMGASTKEKGMLKLVHPGRHVEYHRKSITAAEIMRKNPRHCITRSDFFENPSIVVHPKSVLVPGQVFYIVPNTTIHHLVTDRCQQFEQPSSQQRESPCISDDEQASKQNSPWRAWAGKTPCHQFPQEEDPSSSCANLLPQARETTQVSFIDYVVDDQLTFLARDYYLNRNGSSLVITNNDDQQRKSHRIVTNLKSVMKKKGSMRTSLNLRVDFDFSTMT